jgi:ABC-type enterobactin transport system permease subunit
MSEHLLLLTAHLAAQGVEPSQPLPGGLLAASIG